MKNPRKSSGNSVGTFTRVLKPVQRDLADLPLLIEPDMEIHPQERRSPEEESFRSLLHSGLPRQKAPQALRERIKHSIKNMPD